MLQQAKEIADFFLKYGAVGACVVLILALIVIWRDKKASDIRLVDELKEAAKYTREMYESHGRISERFERTAREMVDVVGKFTQTEKKATPKTRATRGPSRGKSREGGGGGTVDVKEDEPGDRPEEGAL